MNRRKERALAALLAAPTVRQAAASCGMSERVLYNFLSDPCFKVALQDARREAFSGTIAMLQASSSRAVKTLNEILDDPEGRPADRLAAARAIIDFGLRSFELWDISTRLSNLEAQNMRESAQICRVWSGPL